MAGLVIAFPKTSKKRGMYSGEKNYWKISLGEFIT